MISKSEHIKLLYQKYLAHTSTSPEYDQLFEYLKNPENLEILKQEMHRDWQTGKDKEYISPVFWDDIEIEIRKRKARERTLKLNRQTRQYWWATAASLLLVIGISMITYLNSHSKEYLTYTTGYGEVEKFVLDDGSQVTLNANSILKWKRDWTNQGKRIAILEGEAWFDVESIMNPVTHLKTGFDVQTHDLTIQVVGTAFNVKSRTDKTDVYLNEGKIHLDLKKSDGSAELRGNKAEIVMNPGESVSYSAKTKKLERAESDQYGNASWMEGTFMYANEKVKDILKSLEEIYGVSFEINDPNILDRKLKAALPYSDWPIVESALELLLQVRLEKKDNKITIIKRE